MLLLSCEKISNGNKLYCCHLLCRGVFYVLANGGQIWEEKMFEIPNFVDMSLLRLLENEKQYACNRSEAELAQSPYWFALQAAIAKVPKRENGTDGHTYV